MKRFDFPVTAFIALAAVAATLAGGDALLACSERIRHGELWRLLSGPFVHSSLGQLARDVVGFVILGAAYEAELGRRRFAGLLAAGLVVPVAAIALLQPALDPYYGLSGAVYALLAFAIAREWRPRPPAWVVALAVVSGGKLLYEAVTGRLLFPLELGDGVVPATLAHLAGAVVGIAYSSSWSRKSPAPPVTEPSGSLRPMISNVE